MGERGKKGETCGEEEGRWVSYHLLTGEPSGSSLTMRFPLDWPSPTC